MFSGDFVQQVMSLPEGDQDAMIVFLTFLSSSQGNPAPVPAPPEEGSRTDEAAVPCGSGVLGR